jgi:hypothetical protein
MPGGEPSPSGIPGHNPRSRRTGRYREPVSGSWIQTALTLLAPLVGVYLGANLSARGTGASWLRDKRLAAYLELLDLVKAINKTFAIGLRVSKLQTESAAAHGHDFEGVEDVWRDSHDELERIEMRINILGGELSAVYRKQADSWISDMLGALDDENPTSEQWDALVERGHQLIDELERVAGADLAVERRGHTRLRVTRRR